MMHRRSRRSAIACAAWSIAVLASHTGAATLTTIAVFDGANGQYPYATLTQDAAGNFYGTSYGDYSSSQGGTVFKVTKGSTSILTLARLPDTNLSGGVVFDAAGTLYGTTANGGAFHYGQVFKIAASTGAVSTVVNFTQANGSQQSGTLARDAAGNFFGTTRSGGIGTGGTVFKIAAGTDAMTTLTSLGGASSGISPPGGVIVDAAGNLYGTTRLGGTSTLGTVFKVAAGTNARTTLATFTDASGSRPYAGLAADAAGNLYGTTYDGGANGLGTVYKVAAGTNALSVVATFSAATGGHSWAEPLIDAAGNLYGTTTDGGTENRGTVYKVAAGSNTITTLASLTSADGATPVAGLVADAGGNLFGSTVYGGINSYGTLFRVAGSGFVVVPDPAAVCSFAAAGCLLTRRRRPIPSIG